MKFIKILVYTFLLFACNLGFSQVINLETVTYTIVPKEDGKVLLNYNEPTTMRVNFTVSRPIGGSWPNVPIKGEISLGYYNGITDTDHSFDIINVSNSDWLGPEHAISKVISKDIIMPAGVVNLAKPEVLVWTYWRFYKEGYPYPYATNGWTDWLNKGYTAMKLNPNKIPTTTFNGPNAVCAEGIYTITNPYTISLENAAGIATLTSLGNNQWKVSRIGNGTGRIILRSASGIKNFDKEISIGTPEIEFIGGNITDSGNYTFQIAGAGIVSADWTLTSPTNNFTMTKHSNTMVNVNVTNWFSYNIFYLTIEVTTTCGEKIKIIKTLGAGSGGPIEET